MKVCVLGCGPSGLMAALAAGRSRSVKSVTIISVGVKSPILGGQYLKDEIPGLGGESDSVHHIKMGEADVYSQKMYGKPDVPCWRFQDGQYPAWSLLRAYDELWEMFGTTIYIQHIRPDDIADICGSHDIVFSTLPRDKMCYKDEHIFEFQKIAIHDGSLIDSQVSNIIIYSGRPQDPWYRTSNLFGHETTEWSLVDGFDTSILPENIQFGIKPLRTDCDCHSEHDNYFRLGRFGIWKHGILTSDAFKSAMELLTMKSKG